jgi:hypothetical protein
MRSAGSEHQRQSCWQPQWNQQSDAHPPLPVSARTFSLPLPFFALFILVACVLCLPLSCPLLAASSAGGRAESRRTERARGKERARHTQERGYGHASNCPCSLRCGLVRSALSLQPFCPSWMVSALKSPRLCLALECNRRTPDAGTDAGTRSLPHRSCALPSGLNSLLPVRHRCPR